MTDSQHIKKTPLKWAKRIIPIIAGGFFIYVMVGFWVLPAVLKPKLEKQLADLIGRKVTIDTLEINPLSLTATASRLTVYEIDGKPFAGFGELIIDARISSVLQWTIAFSTIRVQEPFAVLTLLPDNSLNIDDILARLSPPKPVPAVDDALPRLAIETFQVIDGRATLEDLTGQESIREDVTPISFTLENLSTLRGRQGTYRFVGTGPSGGHFEIEGQLSVNPVRVAGRYATRGVGLGHYWEHVKDLVSFQIINGTVDASGDYTVAIIDGKINATLENGAFQVDNFQLTAKGEKEVLIAIPAIAVEGIAADLQTRRMGIESLQTADGRIKSWLTADGTFALRDLLLPDLGKLRKPEPSGESDPVPAPAPAWQAILKKMEMRDWGLAFEDRTLVHPAELSVDDIDLVVENLSTEKDALAAVEASMQVNQAGRVKMNGTTGIDPLQVDMEMACQKVALKSFQPYLDEVIKAEIASGSTSLTGRLRYHGQAAQPQIHYEGEFSADGLDIRDRRQSEALFSLAHLKASGIALDLLPNKLQAAQVLIDQPRARVAIDRNGRINMVDAFTPTEEKPVESEANLLQRLIGFLIMQFKGPMPVAVDRIRLENFNGEFLDASITPPYSTHLQITEGTVHGLSSEPSAVAEFDFIGRIDQAGTIAGRGRMSPMNALNYTEVTFSMKDFELKPVSPYTGKYGGFIIDKGALYTDLQYQIDGNRVDGNNVIHIDGLELGESVDSPESVNLPIKLGVALLKDHNGRITLKVPVVGNVKDPHFDVLKTIQAGLTGAIDNAGRAPFASVPETDGFRGEELRTVSFGFGRADLQAREINKLQALAKFLKTKNTLTLSVLGTADRQMDQAALMEDQQDQRPSGDDQAAEEAPPKTPAAGETLGDDRLGQLAYSRAETVRFYLTEEAGIERNRVQLKPVRIKSKPDDNDGLVELSLSVD
jgi:hypothetical protein